MYSDDDDDSYYCEEGEEDEEVALDEMEPSYNEKTAMLPNTTLLACEILSTDSITSHMQEIIREVTTVIQIPPISIRMLLNYFNWDKERLIEKFFDGDQEKLFRDAKIISPYTNKKAAELPKLDESKEIECAICCCVYKVKETLAMECGHAFCLSCWRQYLQNKIIDEGMGSTISCAQHQCEILMSDEVAILILDDKKILRKYQHLIANQFVESNKLLRWCPKPDCGNVVKVLSHEQRPVKCKCGHEFCFCCGENWHDPVKCMWLRKWIKKCDDDSETSNWISANTKDREFYMESILKRCDEEDKSDSWLSLHTKECPQCNSTIEKDGGCNHMVCKKCSHDFCWICLGKWEPHGSSWYNCNRFDESEAKKARDSQEKSRSALQRYLFYCNRYMNHMQSLKFENKLMDNIQSKMEAMQQAGMSWIEVQFLQRAVNVLCQCRQTLMYTYVFAFYLKSSNQSIIFEDNQKDLENSTETLSEYLERDLEIPIKSGNNQLVDVKRKLELQSIYKNLKEKVERGRSVILLNKTLEKPIPVPSILPYDYDIWNLGDSEDKLHKYARNVSHITFYCNTRMKMLIKLCNNDFWEFDHNA